MTETIDVAVLMGSKSDWSTMQHCAQVLQQLGVKHECRVISAHRTPDLCSHYAEQAAARGVKVIIAAAGGAAALPGVVAAKTTIPVLGVPIESKLLGGLDSLLSMVQMPGGVPVGTLAIGKAGAVNAALLATAVLALHKPELKDALEKYRAERTAAVLTDSDLLDSET